MFYDRRWKVTPEAEKIHKAWLEHGFDFHDRFGLVEAAAEVVRDQVVAASKRAADAATASVVQGVRVMADELWEEAERPTEKSANKNVSRILKEISTNLHRFCGIQMGQEPLPAAGSRIGGDPE